MRRVRRAGRLAVLWLGAALSAASWLVPGSLHAQEAAADADMASLADTLEDLLVLRLEVDGETLEEGFVGYAADGRLMLPLGELSRLLGLGIEVDAGFGRAEGWLLRQEERFALDVAAGTVHHAGTAAALPFGAAVVQDEDIYVSADLLERWLPVDIEADLQRLELTVTTREALPFQRRQEREAQRKRLGRSGPEEEALPEIEPPYRAWSVPSVDVSAELGHIRSPATGGSTSGRYSAFLAGDLLGLSAEAFLFGDSSDPVSDVRFRLGRRDPDGELLGPLGATEFVAGDIVTPGSALLTTVRAERGVVLSSFDLDRITTLTETSISGELPAGWEVELYRDGILLDFQADSGTGLFLFEDVPLTSGLNIFRLVFYGPQGQSREETRRVFVGPGLLDRGEFNYRLSVSQADTDLLPLREPALRSHVTGAPRYLLETEIGLSERWAVGMTAASLPLRDGRHHYAGIGLRADLGRVFATADAVMDLSGGYALRGMAQTRAFGTGLTVEHTRLFDFESERERRSGDPTAHRSSLRADRTVSFAGQPVWTSLGFSHEAAESGATRSDAALRLSTSFGRVLASNALRWRFAGDDSGELEGSFLLSGRSGPFLLRGSVDYGAVPALAAHGLTASAQWRPRPDLVAEVGLDHRLTTRETGVSFSLNRIFENVAVGFGARYGSDGDLQAGLSLSVGFGFDPRRSRWLAQPRSVASYGAVSARAFLDADGDRAFGEGDRPLAGVQVAAPGSARDAVTDADGLAFLSGLPANRTARVALRPESLEDPYMRPVVEGVRVKPRPGVAAVVDFPVVLTGEIEGTVRLRRPGGLTELRGVEIQLIDERGQVVRQVASAFDGFYLFEEVAPGDYTVRVAPDAAERLKARPAPPRRVTISAEGDVASGIDVILEAASSAPSTSDG